MHDPVTSDPDTRRTAYVVWIAAAVAGTAAVWWLSSYVDSLAVLARSDPEASFRLFRTRVLPALAVIVIVAIGAGAWLARYGLLVLRGGQFPPVGAGVVPPAGPPTGGPARTIGMLLTITGIMVAACPLVMVAIILWLLR